GLRGNIEELVHGWCTLVGAADGPVRPADYRPRPGAWRHGREGYDARHGDFLAYLVTDTAGRLVDDAVASARRFRGDGADQRLKSDQASGLARQFVFFDLVERIHRLEIWVVVHLGASFASSLRTAPLPLTPDERPATTAARLVVNTVVASLGYSPSSSVDCK